MTDLGVDVPLSSADGDLTGSPGRNLAPASIHFGAPLFRRHFKVLKVLPLITPDSIFASIMQKGICVVMDIETMSSSAGASQVTHQ